MGKKKTNIQKWIRYMKVYPPEKVRVPVPSSKDAGKVLTANSNGQVEWAPAPGAGGDLPAIGPDDKGKVLVVNDSGRPAWGLEGPWELDPMAK